MYRNKVLLNQLKIVFNDLLQKKEIEKLSDSYELSGGFAFKSSEYKSEGCFILRVTNISPNGTIEKKDAKYISQRNADNYKEYSLKHGDVLIVMIGGSIGKVGYIDHDVLPALLNQNMWLIRSKKNISGRYIFYLCLFLCQFHASEKNTSYGFYSRNKFRDLLVPCISAEESHTLSKIFDTLSMGGQIEDCFLISKEALKKINSLSSISKKNNLIINEVDNQSSYLSLLRQSILQEAIEGKLTAQWRKDQEKNFLTKHAKATKKELCDLRALRERDPEYSAAALIEKIKAEKTALAKDAKRAKKEKELPPIKPEDLPFELPEGWVWTKLGMIAGHNSGKTLDSGRNRGVPTKYITTSNLYWGFFVLDNLREMLIEKNELDRVTAVKGDLLICEGGEAGRSAVWENDYAICFQNHIHRVRFHCNISPYYIFRIFQLLDYSGKINEYRKGMGITNLSAKSLSSIILPLPPLAEQRAIVERVDQLFAMVDELEKQVSERKVQAEELMQAVLREAFEG